MKVTNSYLDTTNESLEASSFPAGDHKAHINRCAQGIANTRQKKHKRSTKKYRLGMAIKIFTGGLKPVHGANLTLNSDVDQDTQIFGLHERPITYQCIIS